MATYRMLDSKIGRWLGVDPKAELMMGYTPYNSMAKNPMSFNDPDGDVLPALAVAAIVGAAIGGVGNVAYQAWNGNINSWRDGFAAFGIGAVAGGTAGLTGGASAGAFGTATLGTAIASGATAGAVGGSTAGLIQGTGNALYFGNANIGDALGQGFQGAAFGALGGAVIGGIAGGIGYRANASPAAAGVDDVLIDVGGNKISVPGLEVAKNQPIGGLDIAAARASGLYGGPVTSYQAMPFARSLVNGLTVTNPAGSAISLSIPKNFVSIATRNGKGIIYGPQGVSHTNMANAIRVQLNPTNYAPNGYAVFYNAHGQPFNPNTGRTLSRALWHFLLPGN